jgi:aspartate oxidase
MTDPISALLAAIPGLTKAGIDIASASDEAKRNAQLIEFQRVIIQLQSSIASVQIQNASLLRDKEQLQRELTQLEHWASEKDRYKMITVFQTATVYSLLESKSNGEPPHYICPKCYQHGQKMMLQPSKASSGFLHFSCPSCKFDIPTGYRGIGPIEYA